MCNSYCWDFARILLPISPQLEQWLNKLLPLTFDCKSSHPSICCAYVIMVCPRRVAPHYNVAHSKNELDTPRTQSLQIEFNTIFKSSNFLRIIFFEQMRMLFLANVDLWFATTVPWAKRGHFLVSLHWSENCHFTTVLQKKKSSFVDYLWSLGAIFVRWCAMTFFLIMPWMGNKHLMTICRSTGQKSVVGPL